MSYYFRSSCQTETEAMDGSELQTSNIAGKTFHTAPESMLARTRCLLSAHGDTVLIFAFHFHFVFPLFFLSVLFCLPSLSPVVCENREESWSWFQYLWRHQWPGEPLQTLWYGTTRPSLPASHSLPRLFPQSCHGNCCSLLQCFVSLSLCVSVCGAAVDLVNSESDNN